MADKKKKQTLQCHLAEVKKNNIVDPFLDNENFRRAMNDPAASGRGITRTMPNITPQAAGY